MSYDLIKENIPGFIKRVGDRIIEGSNNSLMVFGTDRAAPGKADINSGLGHIDAADNGTNSGTWHVVVGREDEDPNFDSDKSFIYLSMKTDVDKNLRLEEIEENVNSAAAGIFKSDSIRIVARNDFKISVGDAYIFVKSDGTIVLDGPNIRLGKDATERLVKGDLFLDLFNHHQHPTLTGPSGFPITQMIESIHLSSRSVFVK